MQHLLSWPVYVVAAFIYLLQIMGKSDAVDKPIVILVAFDGFRWDYLKRGITPTLQKFSDEGVRADCLQPVFPSKTFTNFFSIATGMYPEKHGVLGGSTFHNKQCVGYSQELYSYDENISPLWQLNELNGGKSGTAMWSGGEFQYRGQKIEYGLPLDKTRLAYEYWPERVDTVLEWILNKNVNLVHLYFEQPDAFCHKPGMVDPKFNAVLVEVDKIFAYLVNRLAETGLDAKADVIVLSDHGMGLTVKEKYVDIKFMYKQNPETGKYSLIDNRLKVCDSTPVVQIASEVPDALEKVYNELSALCIKTEKCDVYEHDKIPERWHLKNNTRNKGALLLVARYPGEFNNGKWDARNSTHGWDNEIRDMDGFFAAKGPHMRKRHFINKKLKNIDIFALVCYILELDPDYLVVPPDSSFNDIQEVLDPYFLSHETPLRKKIRQYFTVLQDRPYWDIKSSH